MTPRCTSLTAAGAPCRAAAAPGRERCRWHDDDPTAKAKHLAESARGGFAKAYGAFMAVAPVGDDNLTPANLETLAGLRVLLAGTLHRLAQLPLDVRTATALGQLSTAQKGLIEGADFEHRLAALEAGQPGLRRVR